MRRKTQDSHGWVPLHAWSLDAGTIVILQGQGQGAKEQRQRTAREDQEILTREEDFVLVNGRPCARNKNSNNLRELSLLIKNEKMCCMF